MFDAGRDVDHGRHAGREHGGGDPHPNAEVPRTWPKGGPAAERQQQDDTCNPARALKVLEERAEHDASQFTARRRIARPKHVEQDGSRQDSKGRQPAHPERKRQQASETKERHDAIVD